MTTADKRAEQSGLDQIAGLLFGVAERTRRAFEAAAASFDLTPAQARALLTLEQPAPMRSLADLLHCDASNVTGIADRLEGRGLVVREAAEGDRRVSCWPSPRPACGCAHGARGGDRRRLADHDGSGRGGARDARGLADQRGAVRAVRRVVVEGLRARGDGGRSRLRLELERVPGDVLFSHIAAYDGKFVYDGSSGVDVGFDERGLFVVTRTQPSRELFRAMRIEQRLADPEREAAGRGPGSVELIDLDTGRRLECTTAISGRQIPWPDGRMLNDEGKVRSSYPRRLQVERRAVGADKFDYILQALEEVFQAAVATGNPVRWL